MSGVRDYASWISACGGAVSAGPLSKRLKINGWQDIRPSDTELVQLFWFFILKSQVSNALKKKNSLSWCNGSSSKSVCLDSSARPWVHTRVCSPKKKNFLIISFFFFSSFSTQTLIFTPHNIPSVRRWMCCSFYLQRIILWIFDHQKLI
jgi:hypothetical protein